MTGRVRALASAWVVACASAPTPAPSGPPGVLAIRCAPDDAEIYLDDDLLGFCAGTPPLRLAAGRHRVEVRRQGFLTRYLEPEVPPGGRAAVDVPLRPVPE